MVFRFTKVFKQFILAGVFILLSSSAFAQVSLIRENFDTFPITTPALPHQGWVNRVIAGNSSIDQWVFNNPGARTFASPISGRFAIFDSDDYSAGGGAENVAMESPSFSAQNFSSIRLKFNQYFDGIYNSTDTILVEVFNGTIWTAVYSYRGASSITNSQDLNITSNLGGTANAKIRFRFVGDWSYYWIIDNVRVEGYYSNDAAVENVSFSSGLCGNMYDSVSVSLANLGLQSMSNFTVRANIVGTLNGSPVNSTVSASYSGSLTAGAKGTIMLPSFNTALGGSIILSAWTELGSDQYRTNDTIKKPQLKFLGTPSAPSASNSSRCGAGAVTLQATGVSSSDSVVWYDGANTVAPVGSGLTYTTPIKGVGNYTYYVSAGRGVLANSLTSTFASGNGQSGVMFGVTAKRTIIVDSFEVSIDAGTHLVEVYYKLGTYVGFETNANAWTLLGSTTVTSTQAAGGSGLFVNVGKSVTLVSGAQYAFYIQLPNATSINYTNGSFTYSNAELQIQTGVGKGANFGATFSPRTFNGGLYYSYFPLCESARSAVQVEVKALPDGSKIVKGTPFMGTFKTGNAIDPHIVADGDSISLEIVSPSNTNNANFGTVWYISNISMKTRSGIPVPFTDTMTFAPTSKKNGSLLFIPSIGVSDSTFRVIVTVASLLTGCDTLIEAYVYVAPRPNASFTFNAPCDGAPMVFVNTSSIISGLLAFEWNFAGFGISQLENPDFVFPGPGNYDVILKTSTDYGYSDIDTLSVLVKAVPQANFNAVNACGGSAVQFTNTTLMPIGTPSFAWDFGDGNIDSSQNTSHIYANAGTYTVAFSVEVNGCATTRKKTVTQSPRASVSFSAEASCNNSEVVFTNSSNLFFGTMGYEWDFGDSNTATVRSPSHTYFGYGTFDVKLRVRTDLGCVDSFSAQVLVVQAPKISIAHTAPCIGQEIQFTNNSVVPPGFVNSYDWNFGDGTTSNTSNPSHTYPGVGTYTLFIRSFSTNGCSDSLQTRITVNEKPKAGIVIPAGVCDGEEVNFLNSTTASMISQVSYAWDFGNGIRSNRKDTSFAYLGTGAYDVTLIATITGGCSDTTLKTIAVYPKPSANFSVISALTKDGTMKFVADESGTGISYQWFFNDGFKSTLMNPIHQFLFDGTYSVKLITKNSFNCSEEHSEGVSIYRTALNGVAFAAELSLYPNPNNGRFIVKLDGASFADMHVNVVNALGQTIGFTRTISAGNLMEINLNNAAKGVYFLSVKNQEGEQSILRFIIV